MPGSSRGVLAAKSADFWQEIKTKRENNVRYTTAKEMKLEQRITRNLATDGNK